MRCLSFLPESVVPMRTQDLDGMIIGGGPAGLTAAAGDVVSDLHQISVATGHAAIAAPHIHKSMPPNLIARTHLSEPLA